MKFKRPLTEQFSKKSNRFFRRIFHSVWTEILSETHRKRRNIILILLVFVFLSEYNCFFTGSVSSLVQVEVRAELIVFVCILLLQNWQDVGIADLLKEIILRLCYIQSVLTQ